MGAQKGNQYYLLRKNEREKDFQSIDEVRELWNGYVTECQLNPITRVESHVKMSTGVVEIDVPMPFHKSAFCRFARISTQTFDNYKKREGYEDFFEIFTCIEDLINEQNYNEGAAGNHNPGLVARKLGLKNYIDNSSEDRSMSPALTVINMSDKKIDLSYLTDDK